MEQCPRRPPPCSRPGRPSRCSISLRDAMTRPRAAAPLLALLLPLAARAADDSPLPPARPPVLQLEAGGPTAQVTALAFGPGGRLLRNSACPASASKATSGCRGVSAGGS